MSDSKAYTFPLSVVGSGAEENGAIHQTSPYWILSFLRWADRDTLRHNPDADVDFTKTRPTDPLVVENDCIQVSVNVNKAVLTHSMNATLLITDVNYMTSIAPGDFVIVNMLNWKEDARRVVKQARSSEAINGIEDGFKGVFKIQSVRKVLQVDPNTGVKQVAVRLSGFAFTEFNNTIYFQPEMIQQQQKNNVGLYASDIGTNWALMTSDKGLTNGQDIVKSLVKSFIGTGPAPQAQRDKNGTVKTPNTLFYVPKILGQLLGLPTVTAAKDLYLFMFGIQQYGTNAEGLSQGMNPSNKDNPKDNFYYVGQKCKGNILQKPEYWNQTKLWSVMNQFINSPLNEMYTSFRVSPSGNILPTVTLRQIPFTNEDFETSANKGKSKVQVTKFLSLPRWKPDPALVISYDLGRDESARINFVQYFGRSGLTNSGWGVSEETAQGNYLFDIDDVKRSGLRPYVISGTFDITKDKQEYQAPIWARIVGDALIGGHLKLNGTFELAGIVEPIAVGDNFEFDGVVYHIEEVSHSCSITQDGKRLFRSQVKVSSGISVDSSSTGVRYAEMENTSQADNQAEDYSNNRLLPGTSESQDTLTRKGEIDRKPDKSQPFQQPNVGTSAFKNRRTPVKPGKKK